MGCPMFKFYIGLLMYNKKLNCIVCALILAGCGSSSSGDASAPSPANPSEINALVKETNFSTGFPGLYSDVLYGSTLNQQGIVRFDISSKIPLYYVSNDGSPAPQKIVKGVEKIEARLGDIFSDVQLLAEDLSPYRDTAYPNENRGDGSYDETTFKNNHGITGGLVLSVDTAYYSSDETNDHQTMCGNASIAPYDGSVSLVIDAASHTYSNDTLLWVKLGNNQGCNWDTDMVVHEMAHAMGMYQHLDDYFGSWSSTAMDILATLYSNDAGTPFDDLVPDLK